MRGLKYEVCFDPKEETSIGVAWISFPGLPPVFFGKEAVFSLARAVGRPLQLDVATKSKTRPSYAKVKVEVDILAHRPQRIRIGIKNSTNGEIRFKWIKIKYDYIPKYCNECRLQGHNEEECFVLHPDLVPTEDVKGVSSRFETVQEEPLKVLQSGKIVGNVNKRVEAVVVDEKLQSKQVLHQADAPRSFENPKKYGKRFLHPNRNPNAWGRVDIKKKQEKEAAQIEAIQTTNSFAMLETEEAASKEVQCETAVISIEGANEKVELVHANVEHAAVERVQEESRPKDVNVGVVLKKDYAGCPTPGGTRAWAEDAFKEHPKNQFVGEVVVSGKDAMKLDKEAAQTDATSTVFEATNKLKDGFRAEGSVYGVDAGGNLRQASQAEGTKEFDPQAVLTSVSAGKFSETVVKVGINDVAVSMFAAKSFEAGGNLNSIDAFKAGGRGSNDVVKAGGSLVFNEDAFHKFEGQKALIMSGQALTGQPCAININKDKENRALIRDRNAKEVMGVDSLNAAHVGVDSLNAGRSFNNDCSQLEFNAKGAGKQLKYEVPIALNAVKDINDDILKLKERRTLIMSGKPSIFESLKSGEQQQLDPMLQYSNLVPYSPRSVGSSKDGNFNIVSGKQLHDLDVDRGIVDPKVYLITTDDHHVGKDAGDELMQFSANALVTAGRDVKAGGAGAFSDDTNMNLNEVCVVNKEANTIPSLDESLDSESASVSLPTSPGNDLIPTAELERLCKSSSPKFGKPCLNINSPPFVPKSLMQVVPHSKRLPTNDELIKQMDWNDTKGFLARQGILNRELALQGHYLLEDEDIFEEEELDDESTAHNFAMVARLGDLSPRDVCVTPSRSTRKKREMQHLEPTRVQPVRSTKSKSKK